MALLNVKSWATGLVSLATLASALPQGGGGAGAVNPTVDSLVMSGPGCPLGSGGIVQQMRNNTPVFLFPEWSLRLPDADTNATSVSKFCNEQISLGNGPVGLQVRIATVSVSGYAALESGAKIGVDVETKLGNTTAGVWLSQDSRELALLKQISPYSPRARGYPLPM